MSWLAYILTHHNSCEESYYCHFMDKNSEVQRDYYHSLVGAVLDSVCTFLISEPVILFYHTALLFD